MVAQTVFVPLPLPVLHACSLIIHGICSVRQWISRSFFARILGKHSHPLGELSQGLGKLSQGLGMDAQGLG